MSKVALQLTLLSVFITGCTVVPTVQYKVINNSKDMEGMTDSFYLQQSVIKLSVKTDEKDKSKSIIVTSAPAEFKETKYGIKAITDIRSSTVVNLTKHDNTDMIDSIGVEVTDNTSKAITDYGGAITALIPLVTSLAGKNPDKKLCKLELNQDIAFSLGDEIKKLKEDTVLVNWDKNAETCLTIELKTGPKDATNKIPPNESVHYYYYSACRDATISGNVEVDGKSIPVKAAFRVSDPRYVQFVQFPAKGSIKHHTQCGVSVVTEATAVDNGAAVIKASTEQIKAISEALKKKD